MVSVFSVIVRWHGFGEALFTMSDRKERFRGHRFREQRSQELRAGFAVPPFPEASRISIKTIAFLHAYCREEPKEIAARFPKCLTLANVHAALCQYFTDPAPYDAEIKTELKTEHPRWPGFLGGRFTEGAGSPRWLMSPSGDTLREGMCRVSNAK
jgi:hypothetical protein